MISNVPLHCNPQQLYCPARCDVPTSSMFFHAVVSPFHFFWGYPWECARSHCSCKSPRQFTVCTSCLPMYLHAFTANENGVHRSLLSRVALAIRAGVSVHRYACTFDQDRREVEMSLSAFISTKE